MKPAHRHLPASDAEPSAPKAPTAARARLEVDDLLLRWRDLGLLPKQAYELGVRLDALHGNPIGGSSLSTAEPRSLPLPSTHLTVAEIG